MPFQYSIDSGRKTVFVRFSGTLSADDLRRFRVDVVQDPEWEEGFHRFVEFGDDVKPSGAAKEIRDAAFEGGKAKDRFGGGKLVVVAEKDLTYGIARMYWGFLGGSPTSVSVFRDRQSALRWLGCEPDAGD